MGVEPQAATPREEGVDAPPAAEELRATTAARWLAQSRRRDGGMRRLIDAEFNGVLISLVVLCVVFGISHPEFFALQQLRDMLQTLAVPYGMLAMGAAFLIMMGQLDLSVGSNVALTMVLMALLMNAGVSPWLAAVLGIGASAVMGLVNVFLVQVIGIPALLATLAMWYGFAGLANGLANGGDVALKSTGGTFFGGVGGSLFGLPVSVWVMFAFAAVLTVVLRFTPFGYRVRSIGSNPEAARFSGIPMARVKVQAFVLAGVLSGVTAILYLAYYQVGDPTIGGDWALFAIAAAVIGGTPLRGGSGTIVGAMLGAILLAAVQSGLVYFDVSSAWAGFVLAAMIVVAVTIEAVVRRSTRGRGRSIL
jgi:ribose transport system permease protein